MHNKTNRRKSERYYDVIPTHILLKGRHFRLHNISNDGMGIVLEEKDPRFFMGERIENIPIPLKSGTITVDGIVTHISRTTDCTVCGIRFQLTSSDFKSILQFKRECTREV